jgi:TRAP-type C4-dicarboxylate transport system substrate-binding protein
MGLIGSPAEAGFLISSLRTTLHDEYQQAGMTFLAAAPIGPHVVFSRSPVRSLEELRKGRYWSWVRDDVLLRELRELGVTVVPLELDGAAAAYDEGRVDGFIAPANVALAFQWTAQVRYVTDLHFDILNACLFVTNRAFDPLPHSAKLAIRTAAAKLALRFYDLGVQQDAALLGGLFQRQGLTVSPLSRTFRAEFHEQAEAVRAHLSPGLVPPKLLARVIGLLADRRAETTP